MPLDEYMSQYGLRAVEAARNHADQLHHRAITSAHMFVGLLDCGPVANFVTRQYDVTVAKAVAVLQHVDLPEVGVQFNWEGRLSDGLRASLEIAKVHARSTPSGMIGTEAILIGLTRTNDDTMQEMLERLYLTPQLLLKEFESKKQVVSQN